MFEDNSKISLRALEPSDSTFLYKWENDPDVWKVSDTLTPFSMFQIEQYILNSEDIYTNKQVRLMIELHQAIGDRTIGSIDLYDFDPFHLRAGVGIFIDGAYRRKGFAFKALDLIEKYAFQTLELHQLYCLISADNLSSVKLFEARNYILTGTKKDWLKRNNHFMDQYQYQLTNPSE